MGSWGANVIPVRQMIGQQIRVILRKIANHLANKYALEYKTWMPINHHRDCPFPAAP